MPREMHPYIETAYRQALEMLDESEELFARAEKKRNGAKSVWRLVSYAEKIEKELEVDSALGYGSLGELRSELEKRLAPPSLASK